MSAMAVEKMLMLIKYTTSNGAELMRQRVLPLARLGAVLKLLLLTLLLTACGGGGGNSNPGDNNQGQGPGVPVGGINYADADSLQVFITNAVIPADGRAVIDFQVTNDSFVAITDLTADDIRLSLARLRSSALGGLTGHWQSYINQIEDPGVGPGTESKLQATTESGSDGSLSNNQDGSYQYRFAASVNTIPPDIADQADTEGLDLSYQSNRSHRVAMQFSNGPEAANPAYDWLPDSGEQLSFQQDVVAIENCNACHGQLALHGGGRTEARYCVTCHNPGSSDANSGNSVDFKQLIHKIHRGADLPSVQAGGEYAIWGFNDTKHDYSNVKFPQDIRNCQICHAGTGTDNGSSTLTRRGDNWSEYASQAACGSCHDDLDFDRHYGGQPDDNDCMSCHALNGIASSIANSHRTPNDASGAFEAQILSVTNTAQNQNPIVVFTVVNPEQNDQPYDILNDPQWTTSGASLSVKLAWSTTDYTNSGNQGTNASSFSIDALSDASANGDGSFTVISTLAIPDGSLAPNIAATGSGAAVIEGRANVDGENVPLTNVVAFYSIDEADGTAVARRQIVDLDNCLGCHGSLSLHGSNRTDNIDSCVTCHNPRNTDIAQRAGANPPPTDGKTEESIDFKTMIHGVHAGSFRQQPLQVVGFGNSVHVFDFAYPGELKNCIGCHEGTSYTLPVADSVLASTNDTGADVQDPTDDAVTTRVAAVCSSCHDSAASQSHMEANGGNFSTTQADVDGGVVIEQCDVCHAEGKVYSVSSRHGL